MQSLNMIISASYVPFFLCLATIVCGDSSRECVQESTCKCVRSFDGASIDLSLLSNRPFSTSATYSWYYDPCTPVQICQPAPNVAVCQNYGTDAGDLNTATFINATELLYIKYTGPKDMSCTSGRVTFVKLLCDLSQEANFQFVVENPPCTYNFTLTTKLACIKVLPPLPTPSGGLSVGDILLILFFVGLILYFLIGILFQRFYKHNEVGVDLIPNRGFWMALPFLAKDGCKFVIYKTILRNKAPPPYEEI